MWPLLGTAPLDVAQWHIMATGEAGVKEQLLLLWRSLSTRGQSCLSTVQSQYWHESQAKATLRQSIWHYSRSMHCSYETFSAFFSHLFSLIAIGFTEYFFHTFWEKKAHCECCWVLRCFSGSGGHPAPHRIRPLAMTSSEVSEGSALYWTFLKIEAFSGCNFSNILPSPWNLSKVSRPITIIKNNYYHIAWRHTFTENCQMLFCVLDVALPSSMPD